MALAGALGLNLWILVVALPLALGGSPAAARPGFAALAACVGAPALLGVGLWLASPLLLLTLFPVALGLLHSGPLAHGALAPAPLPLAAGSLIAYLIAASAVGVRASESSDPEAPIAAHSLAGPPLAGRWRRRIRVYRGLAVCAGILPAALLATLHYAPSVTADFTASFAGRRESALALVTVGIGLWSVIVFRGYLLEPLAVHLRHDPELAAYTEAAKRQARQGRPRPFFWLLVGFASLALAALVLDHLGRLR